MDQSREQWGSRIGFILAAMGSAVGLGNIWKFPYVTGVNGGGAFLLIYLLCVLGIGIPIMLAEFSVGRHTQSDAVQSFQKLAPRSPWILSGILGVATGFLILSFYSVVSGWTLHYIFEYVIGKFRTPPTEGYGSYFSNFISSPVLPVFWQVVFMIFTILFVYKGVKQGIETLNKILMPTLAFLVIALAIFSLSLDGAKEGMLFLFKPDWTAFTDPTVYLAALGQAFFSLSLGMGVLITYGSYLKKSENLPSAALCIAGLDTAFAILAGIVIFPAVFTFGIEPGSGPSLIFITLPDIFAQLPFGSVLGVAFFVLIVAAALSSSVSLLEVPVAYFMRKFNWTRQRTAVVIGIIITIIGIPSSLGLGMWSNVTIIRGLNIMDSLDFITSNIFLPLGGLIVALFVGWSWNKADALKEADFASKVLGSIWLFIIRFVAPIAILLIFLNSLGII